MCKSSDSPDFGKQIMPILLILCYNGRLVSRTVVSLTATKLNLLYFLHLHLVLCCAHVHFHDFV
jgi:hypothetical protein